MDAEPLSPSQTTTPNQARLRETIAAFSGEGFAIIDGAHFDDVTALLRHEGLFARSLFLDHADADVEKAGPWLVKLDQLPEATDRLMTMVGDKPAAVYWSCATGEMALWHHLRTINMARIPKWAAEGSSASPPTEEIANQAYIAVLFRHWDPRTLGALLPTLDAEQFAKILGPASEISFLATDFGGIKRVVANPDWPLPSTGMLTIRSEQIMALTTRRTAVLHKRVETYLRDVFPEVVSQMPDDELTAFVARSERIGSDLGIHSEAAHKRWAYLVMASDGRVLRTPGALDFIRNGPPSPDRQVRIMIDEIANRIRLRSA